MSKRQRSSSPATPATVRSLRRNKEAFYKTVWPALEGEGWTKIDASESMSGKPIFVPKVTELREGQKGEDFYDDEEAVITRLLERRSDIESSIVDCYLAKVGTNARGDLLKGQPQVQRLDLEVADKSRKTPAKDDGHFKPKAPMPLAAAEAKQMDDEPMEDTSRTATEDMDAESGLEVTEEVDQMVGQSESEPTIKVNLETAVGGGQPGARNGGNGQSKSKEDPVKVEDQEGSTSGDDDDMWGELSTKQLAGKEGEEDHGMEDVDRNTEAESTEKADASKTGEVASHKEELPDEAEGSSGDHTYSAATQTDSAKKEAKERGRRKRSTNKNKHEKANPTSDRKVATGGNVETKGKNADEVSDRDGSDYQSSEDSHQERKRRRKTASPAPSGRGRGKSRPRGRPRRKPKAPPSPKRGGTSPRGRKPRQPPTALLDLSWKNGGKNFPKKISQVGSEFNATSIEAAGTWKEDESTIYCEQIWDPDLAEEKLQAESNDFLAARSVPHNKREAAMIGLAEVGYDSAKFDEENILSRITTKDGSEWTEEERKAYHTEIFRLRKNIRDVSEATGKSMNSCFAYYLGTFKKSDDYRLLKSVCYQERLRRLMESEHDLDACAICGDGGNLLICDGCEGEFHMECLRPALKSIPEGKWECDECVDRAFLAAKDSLIRNSNWFERLKSGTSNSKKEEDGEPNKDTNSDGTGSLRVRPTSPVLDIISKLAQNISAAFTDGGLDGE